MNYIGIRGHRGAGKSTIAYLLGNTINELLRQQKDSYDEPISELYQTWCDEIVNNENIIHDVCLDKIYFESFSDTIKIMIKMFLGCPQEFLYSDYHKDHVVINLRDFTYKVYESIPENIKTYTSKELYECMSKVGNPITITKNVYITLREFILYFGREVMQRHFGMNVWVKSLKSSQELFTNIFNEEDCYKIYMDVKTPGEVTYIKNLGGVIIKVVRPGHKKPKGIDKLSQDNRFDYEVTIGENLYDTINQVINIAKDIITKYNNYDKEETGSKC